MQILIWRFLGFLILIRILCISLDELEILKKFLNDKFSGKATSTNFNEPQCKISYEGYNLSKSKIRNLIVDCSVINSFSVPKITNVSDKDTFLITFYKTELSLSKLLEKLQIDNLKYQYCFYEDDSISVTKDLYDILEDKVPYLISMISSDISKIVLNDVNINKNQDEISIPEPTNEPTIGVIDTLFDENVYFNKWVQNTDYLDEIEKYSSKIIVIPINEGITEQMLTKESVNETVKNTLLSKTQWLAKHYEDCDKMVRASITGYKSEDSIRAITTTVFLQSIRG